MITSSNIIDQIYLISEYVYSRCDADRRIWSRWYMHYHTSRSSGVNSKKSLHHQYFCFWSFFDILGFYAEDNWKKYQGETNPTDNFRDDIKTSSSNNKTLVPPINPLTLFCMPYCIPKLRGYIIEKWMVSKSKVRTSLSHYHCIVAD